jgi:hypothetical protein
LNDIGRNFWLGNRKKITKCLMRTFTCHSTFLYDARLLHSVQDCTLRRKGTGVCSHSYRLEIQLSKRPGDKNAFIYVAVQLQSCDVFIISVLDYQDWGKRRSNQ